MTDDLADAQRQHLDRLQTLYAHILENAGYDGVLLYSGHPRTHFADDQPTGFIAYAHFLHWVPMPSLAHSWLLIRPGHRPLLRFYAPSDFWHLTAEIPSAAWGDNIDIALTDHPTPPELPRGRFAVLGDVTHDMAGSLPADLNPARLTRALDDIRLYKSDYEVICLREANRLALVGHHAAADAFSNGGSELDSQLAYLAASRQRETALPYPNIIATNQHAGVLHYQHYATQPPAHRHSLLVDAGYRHHGHCADISRTTAGPDADERFVALIDGVTEIQRQLIAELKPGLSFPDLHQQMHRRLGELLIDQRIVRCTNDSAVERGITRAFCPHGLGHSLGLQVHDVGGLTANDGTSLPPPASDPALRLTRTLDSGMVVTIEPGWYVIPMLLDPLRDQPVGRDIAWPIVDTLVSHGGIRIEDNLLIRDDGYENLTRVSP
ncbi:Xaa-Pro dipeptidase [Aidingimonas lacisalsi]|uniref:Xaa-Pro dipeptidase n=1 Tax=Aidingimonas lacisalsi TaxID=2604086 RepID=UPI0011D1D7AE|nr:Xaa-Pro dipeptidase [Aidingimonas lacisalsi]